MRSRPLIFLLVLLSLTLLVIDRAGDSAPTHPIRAAMRDVSQSLTSSVDRLWPFGDTSTVRSLKAQNAQLRKQLDVAQGQAAQAADAEHQRDVLSALAGLQTPDNVPKVIANVIAVGASNFDSTIELGKGSDAGIGEGMPVVNDKGLIGRVIRTSRSTSTVLLIQDTTSNVGVRFPDGEIGVAVGTGMNKPMRVDLLDLTSQVQSGDVAVTSGEDHSVFPAGIPVGTLRSVNAGPEDLRKAAQMNPIVDVNKLNDVAVLQWKAQ